MMRQGVNVLRCGAMSDNSLNAQTIGSQDVTLPTATNIGQILEKGVRDRLIFSPPPVGFRAAIGPLEPH